MPRRADEHDARRTPQGVRGLKYGLDIIRPAVRGRTPQGVRGLKSGKMVLVRGRRRRTPQGVRGLKCDMMIESRKAE